MKVPFFTNQYQEERYGHEILARIGEVNKKGAFILGPEVKRFEERMAAYTGARHAIGVANGSDALFLALEALKIPEGSEVITTPFTFFASTSCIVRNRLKPVFVDVNERTCNIDAGAIEARLTPKTRAILPVDLFCQTAEFLSLAIEVAPVKIFSKLTKTLDCVQAFGSFKGNFRSVRTIGEFFQKPSQIVQLSGKSCAIFFYFICLEAKYELPAIVTSGMERRCFSLLFIIEFYPFGYLVS